MSISTQEVAGFVDRITDPNVKHEVVMDTYVTWADTYDQDLSKIDYMPPVHIAETASDVFKERCQDVYLLDVAAGTGLVGQQLTSRGFKKLDAVDGSAEMLEKAGSKGVYKNIMCCMLDGNNKMPQPDSTYDGITLSGALTPGHMKGDCYQELIRVTKPGGAIIFHINEKYFVYPTFKAEVLDPIYKLEEQGLWRVEQKFAKENCMETYRGFLFVLRVMK